MRCEVQKEFEVSIKLGEIWCIKSFLFVSWVKEEQEAVLKVTYPHHKLAVVVVQSGLETGRFCFPTGKLRRVIVVSRVFHCLSFWVTLALLDSRGGCFEKSFACLSSKCCRQIGPQIYKELYAELVDSFTRWGRIGLDDLKDPFHLHIL